MRFELLPDERSSTGARIVVTQCAMSRHDIQPSRVQRSDTSCPPKEASCGLDLVPNDLADVCYLITQAGGLRKGSGCVKYLATGSNAVFQVM